MRINLINGIFLKIFYALIFIPDFYFGIFRDNNIKCETSYLLIVSKHTLTFLNKSTQSKCTSAIAKHT